MIDWVTANIPCHHDEMIFGGAITSINLDGEIEWKVEKKQQVRGTHESNINIKSIDNKTIHFDGNPAKWLQGHNVFGSDNLIGIVEAVMHKLIPILKLTPTEYDLEAWKTGSYFLKRVDCTAMWDLPRRADVRAWLRAAEMQSKSRHGRPVTTGGTLYFGKNSRRWSVKFYAKDDEVEARGHKLPYEIELRDNLIEYADNKLRGELTLRSIQLKEKNLSVAQQWNESNPIEQLIKYKESLNMSEQFSITQIDLEGLPARLIAVYTLWKDGVDLRYVPQGKFLSLSLRILEKRY